MRDQKIQTLVLTALMTALCAVMTMVIKIPSPMGGYFNLGDCAVLLSAWLLGPVWGAAAAGLGSALSALLGYPLYAPATLMIKALMAAAVGSLFSWGRSRQRDAAFLRLTGGAAAEAIMVAGYFVFEAAVLGMGLGAAANIPINIAQGVVGVASAFVVMTLLIRGRALTQLHR